MKKVISNAKRVKATSQNSKNNIVKNINHPNKLSFLSMCQTQKQALKIPSLYESPVINIKTTLTSVLSIKTNKKKNKMQPENFQIPFSQTKTKANENTISSFLNSHLGEGSKNEEDEISQTKDFFLSKISKKFPCNQTSSLKEYEINLSKISLDNFCIDSTIYNSNSIYSNEINELKEEKEKNKKILNLKINKNYFNRIIW